MTNSFDEAFIDNDDAGLGNKMISTIDYNNTVLEVDEAAMR